MAKKFKATELFLSLGLIASLGTACGGPTDSGDAVEGDGSETMEQPAEDGTMEEGAMEQPAEEGAMEEGSSEGGEGGEG